MIIIITIMWSSCEECEENMQIDLFIIFTIIILYYYYHFLIIIYRIKTIGNEMLVS